MKQAGFFSTAAKSIAVLYQRVIQDSLLKEASALTYQSFLTIVPLLAVLFGIAKGFGLEQILDNFLRKEFADHQEVLTYLLQFSQTTLKEAQGGLIAGIGVFFLLFTAIRLLSSVETALNKMWGIQYGRPPLRKVGDYLALLLTCPILLAISSSVTIFFTAQFTHLTALIPIPESAQSVLLKTLALVPFATSALLFSVILYSMPNAPVSKRAAFGAGCLSAIAFQCVQSWYILFQLRLTKVSAVYGSFVALPLFLVWLWISWLLLLIGGELLVFFQERGWRESVRTYSGSPIEELDIDAAVLACSKKFFEEGEPMTITTLFSSIPRPIRALSTSIQRLKMKKFILDGGPKGIPAAIVPSKEAFSLSLSDLALPPVPNPTPILSPKIETAVLAWKKELKKSSLCEPIEKIYTKTS